MTTTIRRAGLAGLLCALLIPAEAAFAEAGFASVLAGAQRSEANRARDVYRHPAETLAFFQVEPDSTVVELAPGGGWYTEILAPYLREQGKLYAAHYPADSTADYPKKSLAGFKAKLAADAATYDRVMVTEFAPPARLDVAPAGSADVVLTFRNVHNWLDGEGEKAAFKGAYAALKPGGVFGVVEHRAKPGTPRAESLNSGYTDEQLVIDAATAAGFVLEEKSEINANPKDSKDHPKGVWSLPPSYVAGDKAKYDAIGESDRMTLRFRKPKS